MTETPRRAPMENYLGGASVDGGNPAGELPSPEPPTRRRLWLVVPAYNEESCLGETLEQYRGALGPNYRLVFAFEVDLIMAARKIGLATTEVPVAWSDKSGSIVSMRRAAPAMVREVWRLRPKYKRVGIDYAPSSVHLPSATPSSVELVPVVDLTAVVRHGDNRDSARPYGWARDWRKARRARERSARMAVDAALPMASTQVLSCRQKPVALAVLLGTACGSAVAPITTLVALNAATALFSQRQPTSQSWTSSDAPWTI